MSRARKALGRWGERWRAVPARVRQAAVLALGLLLVGTGLVLAVLPGPFTIPLLVAGTFVLATEFAWAQQLLERLRAGLDQAGRTWSGLPGPVRVLVVAAALLLAAGGAWALAAAGALPEPLSQWVHALISD